LNNGDKEFVQDTPVYYGVGHSSGTLANATKSLSTPVKFEGKHTNQNGNAEGLGFYSPWLGRFLRIASNKVENEISISVDYRIEKQVSDVAVNDDNSSLFYDPQENRLVVAYEIKGDSLWEPAKMVLEWVDEAGDVISEAYAWDSETSVGSHKKSVDPASLGNVPHDAVKLRLKADHQDRIFELDEDNNTATMPVPDLAMTAIRPDSKGRISFSYDVRNAPLPNGASVSVYWASGDSFTAVIGAPIYSVPAMVGPGSFGPFFVDYASLGTPPSGATGLLAAVDPPSMGRTLGNVFESNESNNVLYVSLPQTDTDVLVKSLEWDFVQGGANLVYEIKNDDLPFATDISLFWSDGNGIDGGQTFASATLESRSTQTKVDTYSIHIPASAFSVPPRGTTHLVVILDREKRIDEYDESPFSNEKAIVLELKPPDVQFTLDTTSPKKGVPYKLIYKITNNGPIPMVYALYTSALDRKPDDILTTPDDRSQFSKTIGFKETQDVSMGSFTSKWDWIDRENPLSGFTILKDFDTSTTEELINRYGHNLTKGILKTINFLDFIIPLFHNKYVGEISFNASVHDTVLPFHDVRVEEKVEISIPVNLLKHYSEFLTQAALGDFYVGLAIKSLAAAILDPTKLSVKLSLMASASFIVTALAKYNTARDQYDQAVDPPDYDYTRLATAVPLTIPEIEDLPTGLFKELAKTSLKLHAVLYAASQSRDRSVGAEMSGDLVWQSRQLEAAAGFTAEAAVLQARLTEINSHLLPFYKSHLVSYRDQVVPYLTTYGIPESSDSLFTQFGWTTDEIEGLRQHLLSTFPELIDETNFIATAENVSALMSTSISVGDLEKAIDIRVDQLGETVRSLNSEERLDLNEKRARIESGLAMKIPTSTLFAEIDSFLESVRRLIGDTNNIPELRTDLDFGYAALADYLQLEASTPYTTTTTVTGPPHGWSNELPSTLTATVNTDEGAFPTGRVQFFIDGSPYAIGDLQFDGSQMVAKVSVMLQPGHHVLRAEYLPDAEYTGSISGDQALFISQSSADGHGPKVTSVVRYGYHTQPTSFVVSFDSDLDPARATELSNYVLVASGFDGRFGTRDDRPIHLRSITYDAATRKATLNPFIRLPLRRRYKLILKGSNGGLSDSSGRLLDGDGDGIAGGDHVRVLDQRILAGPAPKFRKLSMRKLR
jgi:hypothetical protein